MSNFHRDDPNGKKWTWAQKDERMGHRDRKSSGAKRKHTVVPIETLFSLSEEHGRGFGSAEDKAQLAEILAFRGIADYHKPPFGKGMLHFGGCENTELKSAYYAGALDILEINVINNASGAPQYLEMRYRIDGVDGPGEKRFAILFRGTSDFHVHEVTGVAPEILVDEWNFLAEAGLFIFHGADDLVRAAKEAEANGSTITILWCEGMHSKAGVEALLAHPDNLAGVENYKRVNRTEIVVLAWISGLAGIMATNFELRPDEHFVSPINEYQFDWREFFIDKVIVIPDSDNQGMIEAKALVRRLTEEFGLSRHKVDMARCPPGLKKSQIADGWDDHDPLPHGVTPQERLVQILNAPPFETRETILVHPDLMHDAANAVEQALIDDGDYYQRGGDIVTVGKPPTVIKGGKRGKIGDHFINQDQMERAGQRMFPQEEYGVFEAMAHVARYEEPDKRGAKLHPIAPPMSIARMLMARKGRLRLPHLVAVLDHPTIRADGELLTKPGYDEATGLYLDFKEGDYPVIPDRPTKDDAREELEVLKGLCPEFPFVTDADRSVYLAFLTTSVSRTALASAFAFGFSSPKARTGKSMLVDSGSALSCGGTASVINWSKSDTENDNCLDMALMAGSANIAIDNVDCEIRLARLASILTQRQIEVRIFHTKKGKTVPSTATFSFTGRDLEVTADLAQRFLKSSLNAECDRPELRTFNSINPVEQISADRGRFVKAALTIMRAYVVAGRPEVPHMRVGSFEGWCDWIGAALVWLGEVDPCETQNELVENDSERQKEETMFAALEHVFQLEEVFTAAEIIANASARNRTDVHDENGKARKDEHGDTVTKDNGPKYPELLEATRQIAAQGKGFDNQALGNWLRRNTDNTVGAGDFKRKLIRLKFKVHGAVAYMLKGKRPNFAGDDA